MKNCELKKRAIIYLGFLFSFLILSWLATVILHNSSKLIWGVLSVLPVLATILTKAILHDSTNVIGKLPVLVSILGVSPLLGPNSTGLIGMNGPLTVATILFWQLNIKKEI